MKICPETNEPVLYPDCLECETRVTCGRSSTIPTFKFGNETVKFIRSEYAENNTLAVLMEYVEGEWAGERDPITVNLGISLKPNEAFVDVNNLPKGFLKFLEQEGIAKPTGMWLQSGFVKYPLCEVDLTKMA